MKKITEYILVLSTIPIAIFFLAYSKTHENKINSVDKQVIQILHKSN